MADLPADRTSSSEPPFTYWGADMFRHYMVKEGRKSLKSYCVSFTCMSSRAHHIEVTAKMDTDSLILVLRRFVARQGSVGAIRLDNGGNFVGTENEMKRAWDEMYHSKIAAHLNVHNCDCIGWKRNVPMTIHMGGSWERQIRRARSLLNSMLKSQPRLLDNEFFCTLMAEVVAIVNSYPLTLEDISYPNSMPSTPNYLLALKSKIVMHPPGVFQEIDVYCRKRWRVVKDLENSFWTRWRKQ